MTDDLFVPEGKTPKFPENTDPTRAVIAPNMMVQDLELEMSRVMGGNDHSGIVLCLHNAKVLSKQVTAVLAALEGLARGLDQMVVMYKKQNERVETLISNQKFLFDELVVTKYQKNAKNKAAKKSDPESQH